MVEGQRNIVEDISRYGASQGFDDTIHRQQIKGKKWSVIAVEPNTR